MRRILGCLLMGLVLTVALAGPAAAARDPFQPLVSSTTAPVTSTAPTTTTVETTSAPTHPVAQPGSENMPNTGADLTPWLAVAYAFIALGVGALALSRTLRPVRV